MAINIRDVVTLDTETDLIAPGRIAPQLVCATSFDNRTGRAGISLPDTAVIEYRDHLKKGRILCGHGFTFDLGVMTQRAPNLMPLTFEALAEGRIICTLAIEQMQLTALGTYPNTVRNGYFTLAGLAERHLGEKLTGKESEDSWRFRYRELIGVPLDQWPEEAKKYAIDDSIIDNRVLIKQLNNEIGLPPCLDVVVQSNFALQLMSAWGVRTDAERVAKYKAELDAVVNELRPKAEAAGLYKPDGKKNTKLIKERIEKALGDEAEFTPTGEIKAGYEQLIAAATVSEDESLKWLAELAKVDKILSTYMPWLERGVTEVINPSYGFAESIRTSAYDPNIQNLPRTEGVRDCITPRPGFVFVAIDYSMAELCAFAQIALNAYGESEMADALRAGNDPHVNTAATFLSIEYAEAKARKDAGDEEVLFMRQFSKIFNFGKLGGMGPKKLMVLAAKEHIPLDLSKAKLYNRLWLDRYSEAPRYFDDISAATADGSSGMIEHDLTGYLRGGMDFKQMANHYFQHLVAYGARRALFDVARACYTNPNTPAYGCRPVAFIHDEILYEVPIGDFVDLGIRDRNGFAVIKGNYSERADALCEIMVNAMQKVIPDIPIKAEITVMRHWSKKAKSVKQNGLWTIADC